MGTTYAVTVFYGTYVPKRSRLGRKLNTLIAKHGGTPAPAGHGVEVGLSGDINGRDCWITIQAIDSSKEWSTRDPVDAPQRLGYGILWERWLRDYIESLGIGVTALPAIGWHIAPRAS